MDYMGIILKGATNPNTIHFFTDYLIREYKKAANIGLSKDEFFSGCGMVVGWLYDELKRVYEYWLTVLPYCEHPEKLDKWSCKIDLQRFSNGSHTGTMTGDDVYLILKSFEDAEKLAFAPAPAPVATSPEPAPPPGEYPHHRIFMSAKAWQFFQRLKNEFVTNELADYSYIFHKMKSDGFIYDDIKQLEFIDWLSDTFNIELNASQLKSFGVSRNDKKEKIYTSIKQGFKQK
ncbi:MAG TPA: hypothetical protein PK489_13210 [Prolixibacteraceae bacterium]|mgnify:CR=1 FL=1|nr:hypothetical protein [Prolixibacteraceae bacterium]